MHGEKMKLSDKGNNYFFVGCRKDDKIMDEQPFNPKYPNRFVFTCSVCKDKLILEKVKK